MSGALPRTVGPYQVLRLLGEGGMGRVYEVRDPARPDVRLALKQALTARLGPAGVARFRREGELLARLRHPNVVGVHALGESPEGPWLLMDLVEGQALGERLKRGGPLAPAEAVRVGIELASAVSALHAAGVLHRDLKPDNALLRPDGSVVLIDFGLAWAGDVDALTRSGVVLGSPGYLSPEQAEGKGEITLDARTDVWGLGATLFALTCGRAPFGGDNLAQVLNRVLHQPPRWPRRGPPRALRRLIERALDKDPARRPASAAELEQALRVVSLGADRRRWLLGAAALGALAAALSAALRPAPAPVLPAPSTAAAGSAGSSRAEEASAPPGMPGAQEAPAPIRIAGLEGASFYGPDQLLGWEGRELRLYQLAAGGEAPRVVARLQLRSTPARVAVDPHPPARVAVAFGAEAAAGQRFLTLAPGSVAPTPPFGLPRTLPLEEPWQIAGLAWGAGRQVVAAITDRDGASHVWRFQPGQETVPAGFNLKLDHSPPRDLLVCADRAILVATATRSQLFPGEVGRWKLPPPAPGRPLPQVRQATPELPLAAPPLCLALDPTGTAWAGCEDGELYRLALDAAPTPAPWAGPERPGGPVASLRFHGPRAWTLARTEGRERVTCWRVAAEGWREEWSVRRPDLRALELSPRGDRLLVTGAGWVEVWDALARPD